MKIFERITQNNIEVIFYVDQSVEIIDHNIGSGITVDAEQAPIMAQFINAGLARTTTYDDAA